MTQKTTHCKRSTDLETLFEELKKDGGLDVVYSTDPVEEAELIKKMPPFTTFVTTNFPPDFEEELLEDGSAYAYFRIKGSGISAEKAKMKLANALKKQKRYVTMEKNGELSTLVDEHEFPLRWPPDPRPAVAEAAIVAARAAETAVEATRAAEAVIEAVEAPQPIEIVVPEVSDAEAQEPEIPPVPAAPSARVPQKKKSTRGRYPAVRVKKEDFVLHFRAFSKPRLRKFMADSNIELPGKFKKQWVQKLGDVYAQKVADGVDFDLPPRRER
jgi:hypothetical protein